MSNIDVSMNYNVIKYTMLLACISLYACKPKQTLVSNIEESHIIINKNTVDSSIYKAIAPYKIAHDKKMTLVIAESEEALVKADVESTLGNFFCDAVISETKILLGKDSNMLNVSVFNKGGLRNSLPKGNITVGNIFELMPFDNELVLLKLSGEQFNDMLNKIAEKGGIPVGGMTMVLKQTKPTDIFINKIPFDIHKDYWVVTSDYLANGGDSYTFFKNALERKPLNILLRDVIINYCERITKQNKKIKATLDGRISISK